MTAVVIMLFTLRACPVGRSMTQVLQEVQQKKPEWKVEKHLIEEEAELTNLLRVKENPTLLFMIDGEERGRLTGFYETEAVIQHGLDAARGVKQSVVHAENQPVYEYVKLYFVQDGQLVPYLYTYENETGVKAPRITAVRLLCEIRPDGYDNPIKKGTRLEAIDFRGKKARLTFNQTPYQAGEEAVVRNMLLLTLQSFGIEDVEFFVK